MSVNNYVTVSYSDGPPTHSPDGGRLTTKAQTVEADETTWLNFAGRDSGVSVTNNGPATVAFGTEPAAADGQLAPGETVGVKHHGLWVRAQGATADLEMRQIVKEAPAPAASEGEDASSGSVTAQNRKPWVWTIGF